MIRELDTYYYQKEEPGRSCLLALRSIILESDPEIAETRKWNMPCFTYKKKMFCFLWTEKKSEEPYILLVEGNKINHPRLEQGNRSRMKILRVDPLTDIPVQTVKSVLNAALDLYRTGVVKIKK
jgi:hypothetical protein